MSYIVFTKNDVNANKSLLDPLNGTYNLALFSATNSMYNVSSSNNIYNIGYYDTLTYDSFPITLNNGFYSYSEFATELESKLNSIPGASFIVAFDSNTLKFTITNNSAGHTFSFLEDSLSIGISDSPTAYSASYTSSTTSSLIPNKVIFVRIKEGTSKINGTNHFNATFFLFGDGSFGSSFRYINDDIFQQQVLFSYVKKLSLEFFDSDFNPIELNDYILILRKS